MNSEPGSSDVRERLVAEYASERIGKVASVLMEVPDIWDARRRSLTPDRSNDANDPTMSFSPSSTRRSFPPGNTISDAHIMP